MDSAVREGVVRIAHEGEWLVTGPLGGRQSAPGAAICTVHEEFGATDLRAVAARRLERAGFEYVPTLFTAVSVEHARAARLDGVRAIATAGLTNPAALPIEPETATDPAPERRVGTVNLIVTTDRALAAGTQATLLASCVEAKTATLQATTGFTGTTSDAVAVGARTDGPPAAFAGAATPVGSAARACVREALLAALAATPGEPPESVAAADSGVRTDRRAAVFDP